MHLNTKHCDQDMSCTFIFRWRGPVFVFSFCPPLPLTSLRGLLIINQFGVCRLYLDSGAGGMPPLEGVKILLIYSTCVTCTGVSAQSGTRVRGGWYSSGPGNQDGKSMGESTSRLQPMERSIIYLPPAMIDSAPWNHISFLGGKIVVVHSLLCASAETKLSTDVQAIKEQGKSRLKLGLSTRVHIVEHCGALKLIGVLGQNLISTMSSVIVSSLRRRHFLLTCWVQT